jgi:hypothetical protein
VNEPSPVVLPEFGTRHRVCLMFKWLTAFLWVIYETNSCLKVYSTLINFHFMQLSQFPMAYLEMVNLH